MLLLVEAFESMEKLVINVAFVKLSGFGALVEANRYK
jgi:hypothetical protein